MKPSPVKPWDDLTLLFALLTLAGGLVAGYAFGKHIGHERGVMEARLTLCEPPEAPRRP